MEGKIKDNSIVKCVFTCILYVIIIFLILLVLYSAWFALWHSFIFGKEVFDPNLEMISRILIVLTVVIPFLAAVILYLILKKRFMYKTVLTVIICIVCLVASLAADGLLASYFREKHYVDKASYLAAEETTGPFTNVSSKVPI